MTCARAGCERIDDKPEHQADLQHLPTDATNNSPAFATSGAPIARAISPRTVIPPDIAHSNRPAR